MRELENSRSGSTGPVVGPLVPEPSRAPEGEDWAWMVDEDPAFYLEEGVPSPEKRGA